MSTDNSFQDMALRKVNAHLVEKAAVIQSLADAGMICKFSYMRRHKEGDRLAYTGLASVYSKLDQRETLIAFANWFYASSAWIEGTIEVFLYPAGQKYLRYHLLSLRTWFKEDQYEHVLKLRGKLWGTQLWDLKGITPPRDHALSCNLFDWAVHQQFQELIVTDAQDHEYNPRPL